MLKLVARRRTPDRKQWERSFVTVEGDNPEKGLICSLELGNLPKTDKSGKRIIYTPVDTKLYLLDYLMVVHEEGRLPTFQEAMDAFEQAPEDVKRKAIAFEFHHGFYDFAPTDFLELWSKLDKWVSLVALFTEEDTGRELPGVKLKFSRPIGISNEDWETLWCKYSRSCYGYIED